MTVKLEVNADRFPNDMAVAAYIQSRVGGQALEYLEAWLQATPDLSSIAIIAKLEQVYADPAFKVLARS